MVKSKISIKKVWNFVADDFQKQHKMSAKYIHYGPWMPTDSELKLVGNVKGKRVLEVGCGGGQCSIAFAKQGAIVTGIDLSESQIEYAKRLAEKEGVKVDFRVCNAENLKGIKSNSFDIAFSSYAFQYIKNLRKVFKETHRVLKKNGVFVFSFNHPFLDIFAFGKLKVFRSYYKKGLDVFPWWVGKKKTKAYNIIRTVEGIFTDLVENGFVVERLLEPYPVNKDKAQNFSKTYPLKWLKMVPSTIVFKARKK